MLQASTIPGVFQSAAIGMALIDLSGHCICVNRAICDLLGYAEDELLESGLWNAIRQQDYERFRHWISQCRTSITENWDGELQIAHREGRIVCVLVRASLVRHEHGTVQGIFMQLQDVTPLKESKDLQELIFSMPVALHYIAGFDGYFKKLSPSWETTLGYPAEYLLSTPFLELVHPDDREQTRQEFSEVLAGNLTFLFENRYRCADGSYRWILWTSVTTPRDQLVYGVALDHTAKKQAELRLSQTVAELQQTLNELHASSEEIAKLRAGLLKICAWTKHVQHEGCWIPVDKFLSEYLKLNLTHTISEQAAEQYIADLKCKAFGEGT